MPRITKVYQLPPKPPTYPDAKVLVYIDYERCVPIRERTWRAMGLSVGSEITCEKLRELERFHWKRQYGAEAWKREKVRLDKVQRKLKALDPRVIPKVVGFGADTTDFIPKHADEAGRPDIEVRIGETGPVVMMVEVTGTEQMRGTTYWVRPDKLRYAQDHPEENVWVVLHYTDPERFVFIRPLARFAYKVSEKEVRRSVERYVEFDDRSPGVVPEAEFCAHLRHRVDQLSSGTASSDYDPDLRRSN